MSENDLEIPENRYVYTPMPKASGTNLVIFIFLVIVAALIIVALFGYLSGRWEVHEGSMGVSEAAASYP